MKQSRQLKRCDLEAPLKLVRFLQLGRLRCLQPEERFLKPNLLLSWGSLLLGKRLLSLPVKPFVLAQRLKQAWFLQQDGWRCRRLARKYSKQSLLLN